MRSEQVHPERLAVAIGSSRGVGSRSARQALALADPLSGSIPESLARMLFREAGLPAPVSQYHPPLAAINVRVDFAWPEFMLVVEIDGRRYHIDAAAFQRDRIRQNALMQGKWMVLRSPSKTSATTRRMWSMRFGARSAASARCFPGPPRTAHPCSSGTHRPPARRPCSRRLRAR